MVDHSARMLPEPQGPPIRVMVVDDAVVVRGLLSRWLIDEGGFEVVATCRGALQALEMLERARPDVIVLDIEMPELDGLTALPLILSSRPDVGVIVISSLASTQADLALRCLERGAMDFIAKPGSNRDVTTSVEFRREIMQRVAALGHQIQRRSQQAVLHAPPAPSAIRDLPAPVTPAVPTPPVLRPVTMPPTVFPLPVRPLPEKETRHEPLPALVPVPLRAFQVRAAAQKPQESAGEPAAAPALPGLPPLRAQRRPSILVIGASTGGPSAVLILLTQIKPVIRRMPVVVVQHMPAAFTPIFAEHVQRHIGMDAHEVRDRELIIPGSVFIAPGGRHLRLTGQRGGIRAALDDDLPVNFSKPSVDVLFESAARALGASVIGVVLTGMGSDGAAGAGAIHAAGGSIFVQDEASSVVWGMPGAVYRTGVCQGIGTAPEIGAMVTRLIGLEAA